MEGPLILACSVCKKNFDEKSRNRTLAATQCGHLFHHDCLHNFWEANLNVRVLRRCPICDNESYYDNSVKIHPTVQSNTAASTHMEEAQRVQQELRAEQTKNDELQEKLNVANICVEVLRRRDSMAREELECVKIELANRENQAPNWDAICNQYYEENLGNLLESNSNLTNRIIDLQKKSDDLHRMMITRTKYLLARCSKLSKKLYDQAQGPDVREPLIVERGSNQDITENGEPAPEPPQAQPTPNGASDREIDQLLRQLQLSTAAGWAAFGRRN